ncbi:factor y subunit [Musa troglodytarum]|uniref:Factor y subunit n=1 Tax=Musa troglodytarum TaxID=320322 RepID=A0A9E7KJ13_9LILI|nr:factor y subunit [Musa troglodytarum]
MEDAQDDQEQQRGGGVEKEEEEEEEEEEAGALSPSFPMGRVKKILKLDREINKVTSEALLLVSLSAELFLASLSAGARHAVLQKKRRIIKLDHIRSAARAHRPTSAFLLDCLPKPPPPPKAVSPTLKARSADEKPLPPGARRIDDFFRKPSADTQ